MNERLNAGLKILAIALVAVAIHVFWPKEPRYAGRPVSYWLKELDFAKVLHVQTLSGPHNGYTGEAATAIHHIGAKSLPYIISELRVHDPNWKVKLVDYCKKHPWLKFRFTPDSVHRERGIKACQALGPTARPAIPALGEALGYGSVSALKVLESFGPEAVPALAQALTNAPGCGNPYLTAIALGQMGSKARAAIPTLIWTFENHRIGFPRAAAATASALICKELIEKENEVYCPEVQMTKTALMRGLGDSKLVNPALEALARLGTNTPEAAPIIVRLFQSTDARTRLLATNALHRVAPSFDLAALYKPSASN